MNQEENAIMREKLLSIINKGSIYSSLQIIAERNNLNLDQLGQLNAGLNMLFFDNLKVDDFVSQISKDLEIDDNLAKKIAGEINTEIILSIKQQLVNNVEKTETIQPPIPPSSTPPPPTPEPVPQKPAPVYTTGPSNLEQIGKFTIEPKPTPSSSTLYNDTSLNREDILKSIEDAQPPKPEVKAVPLVDHLLTQPVNNQQKVEEKTVVVDKKENQPPKSYSVDPYREQV